MPESLNPQKPHGYDITFTDVSFAYENKTEATRTDALHHINFTARAGEITALVGPSGSGKSTIANLIPRFWDVEQGEIKIGGTNVKNIATEQLMDLVSFVFQDSFLFFDTIYENIRVGNPHATREQVIAAAQAAQCDEFIQHLPKQYDTIIGEEGVYLSGGEEQRISVARAILKKSPLSSYWMKQPPLPIPKMNTRCNLPFKNSSGIRQSSLSRTGYHLSYRPTVLWC